MINKRGLEIGERERSSCYGKTSESPAAEMVKNLTKEERDSIYLIVAKSCQFFQGKQSCI